MRHLLLVLAAIAALAMSAPLGADAASYTYADLVERLIDLEALAVLPDASEVGAQASSYDRASRYDAAAQKYVGWDANGDNAGIVREENGKQVLADLKGPGCIVRIWSAMADKGHVRIYLDGSDTPAVDLPFIKYFDRTEKPFDFPGLVHRVSSGLNNYVPIPYARSCKIVADSGWGAYYHFNYVQFPEGTEVPTFKMQLGASELGHLARVDTFFRKRLGTSPYPKTLRQTIERKVVTLRPGQSSDVFEASGPAAFTSLKASIRDTGGAAVSDILRACTLEAFWDGEREPSVWSPLGDFFGSGPGSNNYLSLPMGNDRGMMYSYWYMPFARSGRIRLSNDSASTIAFELQVSRAPLRRSISELGRFHAKWHRNAFLPSEPERKAIDWTLLMTDGRGRYVGTMLEIWNPRGSWWGEGDEKFFVDGEKFPSTIGTGSEDYFGYAWCNPALFQHALHNQTRNDGDNRGHVSVNRWHITDNIPFHTSFEGAIEKYYPDNRPTHYASVAYWYLKPGGKDPYGPVSLTDRTDWYPAIQTKKVAGAIEGESLEVKRRTGGDTVFQDLSGFGPDFSNDAHLFWINTKPGDTLELAVPVAESGRYDVRLRFTRAPDYATVLMNINGEAIEEALDLYSQSVQPMEEYSLGVHQLNSPQARLELVIGGANQHSTGQRYLVGLDYVRLAKQ